MIALWLALSLAFAQDDTGDDGVDASTEDGVLVVRVYGEEGIRIARQKVIDDMERQGWRVASSRNGQVVFRGPSNWMGSAVLDDEGTMSFTTPAAAFQGVGVDDAGAGSDQPGDSPLAQESRGGDYQATSRDPGAEIVPQVSFALYPKKKSRVVHERLLAEVGPELAEYRDVVQYTAFKAWLEGLTDRLDALWELGTPIEPGQPSVGPIPDRRRTVLAYWASRADNPEGAETCAAVEEWLAQVVQSSTDPVTLAEQEQANAAARHGRRLSLVAGP